MKKEWIILVLFVGLSVVMIWQKDREQNQWHSFDVASDVSSITKDGYAYDDSEAMFNSIPEIRAKFLQAVKTNYSDWTEEKIPKWNIKFKLPPNYALGNGLENYSIFSGPLAPSSLYAQLHITEKRGIQNYKFAPVFYGGRDLSFNSTAKRWEYVGKNVWSQDKFTIGQTIDGHDIFFFSWGDAGSIAKVYIVPIPETDSVIEIWASTDKNPLSTDEDLISKAQIDFEIVVEKIISTLALDIHGN